MRPACCSTHTLPARAMLSILCIPLRCASVTSTQKHHADGGGWPQFQSPPSCCLFWQGCLGQNSISCRHLSLCCREQLRMRSLRYSLVV